MQRITRLGHVSAIAALAAALPSAQTIQESGITIINVEVDYMVAADHDHMLGQLEVDALVQMFACHGILLNIVVDDPIPEQQFMQCPDPADDSFFGCDGPLSFQELKDQYADFGPTGWHYCIMGHQFNSEGKTGSSGKGELPGANFVVTLGNWAGGGTPFERAATFAHELGHNLNLEHWATTSGPGVGPFGPNYPSVMSYQYQLSGVRSQLECLGFTGNLHLFKDLDYSNGRMPHLHEAGLDEAVGVGMNPVDFDCDGWVTTGLVSRNIDASDDWCDDGVGSTALGDSDDWANLVDVTWWPLLGQEAPPAREVSCITWEEARRVQEEAGLSDPSTCTGTLATLTVEPCVSGQMVWADASAGGLEVGTGPLPFHTATQAQAASPEGSVVYLQPGTFGGGGGTLLLDKPMFWTGPGGALIAP